MDARTDANVAQAGRSGDRSSRAVRPRRTRRTPWIRRLTQETRLTVDDLIWPIFVMDGGGIKTEAIPSMPSISRHTIASARKEIETAAELGIPAIAVFPYTDPDLRTSDGAEACNPDNLVCRTLRALKDTCPDVGLIADVALDPYTDHGHDGLLWDGVILNDETVDVLVRQSLVQAEAGCDIVAPSDMMDGRVGAIRDALEANDFQDTMIMAYSAKYASAFYGPFRDAVGSSNTLKGDKRTYQMDPSNGDEAEREAALDIAEGADMIMVKPGLPYLDVLHRLKSQFNISTYAFQVSGEFSIIKAASENGWLDGERAIFESLQAFKRAGADGVLTYFAPEIAARLARGE